VLERGRARFRCGNLVLLLDALHHIAESEIAPQYDRSAFDLLIERQARWAAPLLPGRRREHGVERQWGPGFVLHLEDLTGVVRAPVRVIHQ
jgi:hypothetical protein